MVDNCNQVSPEEIDGFTLPDLKNRRGWFETRETMHNEWTDRECQQAASFKEMIVVSMRVFKAWLSIVPIRSPDLNDVSFISL